MILFNQTKLFVNIRFDYNPHKGGGGGGRSQFNGTSTPKGSYSAKTGDNDCNVNSSRYSLKYCTV